MKTLLRFSLLAALAIASACAQTNTLTATTLSSAMLSTDKVVNLTSATNVNAPNLQNNTVGSELYIVAPGQPRGLVALVTAVNGTAISIRPTQGGGANGGYPNGSMVLVGQPNWFYNDDPSGGCTAANTNVTPRVNTKTGQMWLCSTISLSWVPGWQNNLAGENAVVTALVASVAGATAINGPLQHITGALAITAFTMSAGWNGSGFCVIPDGAFTTTATSNIAKASTAVVNRPLCWTWDATSSTFMPSY